MILSNKEIRNKLLESNDPKGWKYSIGEQMRDNLTDDQAAMLAYWYYNEEKCRIARVSADKIGVRDSLSDYFREIMGPIIEKTMSREIEKYKDNNSITIGQDDCSAYKEHRDLTEE